MDLYKKKVVPANKSNYLNPRSPFAMNFRGVTMPPGNAWSRWTKPFSDSEPPDSSVHAQTNIPREDTIPPTLPISHHFAFQRTTRLSSPWGGGGGGGGGGADGLPSSHLHGLLALLPILNVARNKETIHGGGRHHTSWQEWMRLREGRKEEEGTRGVSVKQICSWEQSRLHHRQASGPFESTESY